MSTDSCALCFYISIIKLFDSFYDKVLHKKLKTIIRFIYLQTHKTVNVICYNLKQIQGGRPSSNIHYHTLCCLYSYQDLFIVITDLISSCVVWAYTLALSPYETHTMALTPSWWVHVYPEVAATLTPLGTHAPRKCERWGLAASLISQPPKVRSWLHLPPVSQVLAWLPPLQGGSHAFNKVSINFVFLWI